MKYQDKLRQQVKLAKALNPDFNYKAMAEIIGISAAAFYNWLSGAYELGYIKVRALEELLADLNE